jgi:hypothetical protein
LHGKRPDALARGKTAETIGHMQPRALLSDDYRPDIRLCGSLKKGINGKSNQELDPFPFQDLSNSGATLHTNILPSLRALSAKVLAFKILVRISFHIGHLFLSSINI